MGLDSGWNTYVYVAGNPVSAVEYLGLEASWSRKTADFLWGINSSLTFGLSDYFAKPDSVCTDSEYYTRSVYTADAVTLVVAPVKGAVNTGVKKTVGKYAVGQYKDLKAISRNTGLDIHHVGQKAHYQNMIPGYNPQTGPSIAVPYKGHRENIPDVGYVSREMNVPPGTTPRDILARDIKELRRVYPDIPNKNLQELVNLNKQMYPGSFTPPPHPRRK